MKVGKDVWVMMHVILASTPPRHSKHPEGCVGSHPETALMPRLLSSPKVIILFLLVGSASGVQDSVVVVSQILL